jgi:hypothetical protein
MERQRFDAVTARLTNGAQFRAPHDAMMRDPTFGRNGKASAAPPDALIFGACFHHTFGGFAEPIRRFASPRYGKLLPGSVLAGQTVLSASPFRPQAPTMKGAFGLAPAAGEVNPSRALERVDGAAGRRFAGRSPFERAKVLRDYG